MIMTMMTRLYPPYRAGRYVNSMAERVSIFLAFYVLCVLSHVMLFFLSTTTALETVDSVFFSRNRSEAFSVATARFEHEQ